MHRIIKNFMIQGACSAVRAAQRARLTACAHYSLTRSLPRQHQAATSPTATARAESAWGGVSESCACYGWMLRRTLLLCAGASTAAPLRMRRSS
jgi:hypothetical protein